ncbi:MAG: tetratricopeptide repeat protein [Methanothrix sp.]|nr:tetratricopeptide repeat protein [Methanothrix sp.]
MGGVMKMRLIPLGLLAVVLYALWMMTPGVVRAAEGADDLYGKGRYKEAAKAYQKLDMDKPGDLRYRYDRGCAAYMAGSLDEAKAAFASVVRRSTSDDMRFRALYNLGNTAYKQNDFTAARDSYREALKVRPDDADARHNLELSLKALKQQQNRDQQKQGDGKQQDKGQQGKDKGGQTGSQQGQDQNGNESKDGTRDQGKADQGQQGKKPGQQPGRDQGSQGRQGESKQDLKGELKARDMQAGRDGQAAGRPADSAAMMERKKAEALLDNIGEDRAGMRDLQGGRGGRAVVGSGKEW